MHKPCFVRLAANPRTPCKCPTCAMPWAGKEDSLKIVGEGAVRDGQPTRRRKARNIAEGTDDEAEEEEGEAAPMSEDEQPAKKERKPRGAKGGRRLASPDLPALVTYFTCVPPFAARRQPLKTMKRKKPKIALKRSQRKTLRWRTAKRKHQRHEDVASDE